MVCDAIKWADAIKWQLKRRIAHPNAWTIEYYTISGFKRHILKTIEYPDLKHLMNDWKNTMKHSEILTKLQKGEKNNG